jgi:glyoxylase-like metal-dependent hydrolase (beta-lactamase superfamily II)
MTHSLRIGEFQIDLINDARIMGDYGGVFGLVPRTLWSKQADLPVDELGRVPMDHHCLLVRSGDRKIVIETGYGTKLSEAQIERFGLTRPEGGLVHGLARLGVKPEEIDLVINTHLHGDHCSGNTYLQDSQLLPTFPNAEYLAQRLECADATYPNERTRATYLVENFLPLVQSGQMRLIDGETEIMPGLRCVITPGHTRAHQSIVFESEGQSAIYVSDMASLAVHFTNLAWMTAYDVEPLITLETKRIWQQWVLKHDATLIFVHETLLPLGKLVQDGKRLRVISVAG